MLLTIATAAFDARSQRALANARAALTTAAERKVDLLLLPGCAWHREDLLALSLEEKSLYLAAACGTEGLLLRAGEAALAQPRLYGEGATGTDLALYDVAGFGLALLCGEDAKSPAAARLAALRGAGALLCPAEEDESDSGIWALAQQNGVYAAVAPSRGEARILSPLCLAHPDGVMARGRSGTMAIASLSAAEWVRLRLQYDPLSLLNRDFAGSMPDPLEKGPPAEPLKVAAVQRTVDFAGGKAGLLEKMDAFCRDAKEQGCALIAFPEYNWLDALGSLPYVQKLNLLPSRDPEILDPADPKQLERFFALNEPNLPFGVQAALRLTCGHLRRVAIRESRRLAQRHGIVVHGGTFWEKHKRRLYNTAVVAFPDGATLFQRKLHPTHRERLMGLYPGDELNAFSLDGALFCAPVCMDATYYEPFEAARRVGCEAAIVPICNQEPYFRPAACRGAWARAIESCLYIVQPALTGTLLGERCTGYAAIYGPRGPLALSDQLAGDQLVTATLDFADLREAAARLPRPNPAIDRALRGLFSR